MMVETLCLEKSLFSYLLPYIYAARGRFHSDGYEALCRECRRIYMYFHAFWLSPGCLPKVASTVLVVRRCASNVRDLVRIPYILALPRGAAIGRFHEDGCEALRLESH